MAQHEPACLHSCASLNPVSLYIDNLIMDKVTIFTHVKIENTCSAQKLTQIVCMINYEIVNLYYN